jgi:hypothetical protein
VGDLTAQDLFREMINTRISPVLRQAGFKRKGNTFEVHRNGYLGFVNFQKSQGNTRHEVSFTVNVGAYHPEAQEEWRLAYERVAARWGDNATVETTTAGFGERLGAMVHGWDFWWQFHDRPEMEQAADAVVEGLRIYALPAIAATLDQPVPTPKYVVEASDGTQLWPPAEHNGPARTIEQAPDLTTPPHTWPYEPPPTVQPLPPPSTVANPDITTYAATTDGTTRHALAPDRRHTLCGLDTAGLRRLSALFVLGRDSSCAACQASARSHHN